MSETDLSTQCSLSGHASPTSTKRVARWRARRRCGVLFVAGLEVFDRDLRLLKHAGYLASDDPKTIGKAEVVNALGKLLDTVTKQLGLFDAPSPPASGARIRR